MSWMPAASQTARDGRAGDHAGAGPGGHEHHVGGAELPLDRVRNGGAFQVDFEHAAGAVLDGLLDAGGTSLALP